MAIHKLTDLKVKAKIREIQELSFDPVAKNALLGDGQGLYLSIAKKGTASWLFRYMDLDKAKSVGLGGYPATALQVAREKGLSSVSGGAPLPTLASGYCVDIPILRRNPSARSTVWPSSGPD